ncbi:carbohydrate ABC transporter substrate-binding protein, CUT1 family [Pedococcus dokdonensis]|uniref:Carbohydrate ABC transporter substrate-binding protein, CUT1 family n=2 Tax=Pedococcus dokdonensis TaxID=443156 RepID=A0A1H0N0A9_9MICO|nr:ABC transporter substrate-binding protein [Pedococcus dokdonensis]SDO86062.1 carbohydrate ABC transporter substrate-binding protein, CUT1 family [Pedococcus dokdonensis]
MALRMHKRRTLTVMAGAVAVALVASACGGDDGGNDPAASGATGRGPITYVQGKDNSGLLAPQAERWNAAHPNEKVTIKEQSDQADQQHDDLVQHFQAKDPSYDVVSVDVVWVAEFAAKGWLTPLKDNFKLDTTGFIEPPVKASTYNKTLFAAPTSSDGAMLYYRSDLVKTPPKTIDEMWSMCSIAKQNGMDCFAGQFAKYEGGTCNATEWMNAYGAKVVDDAGKPTVDSPEAAKGLKELADHYKNGDIPKQAITYQEEQSRASFQAGKLLFLRNWPYVYNLASTDASSKVKGKFKVAPLPGVDGPGTSTLGGHQAAISAYSKNKATALDFLKFLTSPEEQKTNMEKGSLAPVRADLYDDPALVAKYPYLPVLKESIANAVARPVTPFYPAVTQAIQDNFYAAIQGQKTPEAAVKDMQAAMQAAGG